MDCFSGDPGDFTACHADNRDHTYAIQSSVPSTGRSRIRAVLESQFEPTDLSVSEESPAVYSGNAETDVIYAVNPNVPSDALAITWCEDHDIGDRCDQWYVRFPSTSLVESARICHESGHTLGLLHGAHSAPPQPNQNPYLGCLRTPVPATATSLGSHNVKEINDTY